MVFIPNSLDNQHDFIGGDWDSQRTCACGSLGCETEPPDCLQVASVAEALAANYSFAALADLGNPAESRHPAMAGQNLEFLEQLFGPWVQNTSHDVYATSVQGGRHCDSTYGWHADPVRTVLVMLRGRKRMRVAGDDLGSETLIDVEMSSGDVVIIPPGFYHSAGGTAGFSDGSVLLSLGDREADSQALDNLIRRAEDIQFIKTTIQCEALTWELLRTNEVRAALLLWRLQRTTPDPRPLHDELG